MGGDWLRWAAPAAWLHRLRRSAEAEAVMPKSDVDVVVIGSGPGGGSTAWGLVKHGVNVVVLEAGPAYDYTRDTVEAYGDLGVVHLDGAPRERCVFLISSARAPGACSLYLV